MHRMLRMELEKADPQSHPTTVIFFSSTRKIIEQRAMDGPHGGHLDQ
jgi:hypothetical protein